MGRFLVQMHHSGYNGFGGLILLYKLQRFIEKLFYWKPRAKELHPSGHPNIFLENGTQTVKMQFGTFAQKMQKEVRATTRSLCDGTDFLLFNCRIRQSL